MKKELKIKLLIVFLCSIILGFVLSVGYFVGSDIIFRMTHKSAFANVGTFNIGSVKCGC